MKSKRATLPRSSTADWWARYFGTLHFTLLWGVLGDDPDYEAWTKDYAGRPAEGIASAVQS